MGKEQKKAMASNVTYGKPAIGGAIHIAPIGTKLPTDAKTPLTEQFINLGYISDDGVKNKNTPESDKTKAWGGDVILNIMKGKEDTFGFNLVEAKNLEVLKLVYGNSNVSGDFESKVTVLANSKPLEPVVIVIDMILTGKILKRFVIPHAEITEIGEIKYNDKDPVGYDISVLCIPDTTGISHYEYFEKAGEVA